MVVAARPREDAPAPEAAKDSKHAKDVKFLPPPEPISGQLWMDDNAELVEKQTFRNEVTGGWRMSFRFKRLDDEKPIEMRAYLKRGSSQVSETWSYVLPPN